MTPPQDDTVLRKSKFKTKAQQQNVNRKCMVNMTNRAKMYESTIKMDMRCERYSGKMKMERESVSFSFSKGTHATDLLTYTLIG